MTPVRRYPGVGFNVRRGATSTTATRFPWANKINVCDIKMDSKSVWGSASQSVTRLLGHNLVPRAFPLNGKALGTRLIGSLGHLVTRSLGHQVIRFLDHSVTGSLSHWVTHHAPSQWVSSNSVSQSVGHSVSLVQENNQIPITWRQINNLYLPKETCEVGLFHCCFRAVRQRTTRLKNRTRRLRLWLS